MNHSLTIGATWGAVASALVMILTRRPPAESVESTRLTALLPGGRGKLTELAVSKAVLDATARLSQAMQRPATGRSTDLRWRLAQAGYPAPIAPLMYHSLKLLCALVGVASGGGLGLAIDGWRLQAGLWPGLLGAAGWLTPPLVIAAARHRRKIRLMLTLPDVLDLIVVCVEAGLHFDSALRRVIEEMRELAPDLCWELEHFMKQLQLGRPRREALENLALRTGIDEINELSAVLIQSDHLGTPITQALRTQSRLLRRHRSQRAEVQASRIPTKIVFALVLCIFPGIFVVLVGPAVHDIMRMMRGSVAQQHPVES